MRLPENWPKWLPRHMAADFWEHYGSIMGIDYIGNTDVSSVKYDEASKTYTVQVKSGGSSATLKSRHVVLATGGFSDEPVMPDIPGQESFKGEAYHSIKHKSATDVPDIHEKRVAVVGSGTSGHDIAEDFARSGAKSVSIIQRNPVYFVSRDALETVFLTPWNTEGISTEEADVLFLSCPTAVLRTLSIGMSHAMTGMDGAMIESLRKAGLAVSNGNNDYGLADYQLVKIGNFYVDQGASQMILDGTIKVHRCEQGIESFQSDGLKLADGTKLEADIIVLATGYRPNSDIVKRIIGQDALERLRQPFGQLDAENERTGVS